MSYPVYYVEENDVLPVLFDSFDGGTGASITLTGLAASDIEIFKDGSITQRSSDAGYTLLDTDGIDFDGITGIHGFSIDLSDNTDSGFYAVGSWYHVVVSSVTIDGQTVNFIACAFRIVSATRGLAGTALPNAAADAAGGLPISDAGGLPLDDRLDAAISSRATVAAILTALGGVTGAVEDHASNSTTQFQSDLAETADDYYNGGVVVFTSGTNISQVRRITDYVGASGTVVVSPAFDAEPDAADAFLIMGRIQ